MTKYFLYILLLIGISGYAQNYIDLAKIRTGITKSEVTNSDSDTQNANISFQELSLNIPIPINDNIAIFSGIDYDRRTTQLGLITNNNLYQRTFAMLMGKIGLNIKHSDKWSSLYIFLPKISAEQINFNPENGLLGGFTLFTYAKTKSLKYKFGLYASNEFFGAFWVPLFGMYYKSANQLLEINMTLPISATANYYLKDNWSVGFDFLAITRSYNLNQQPLGDNYVHRATQEIGLSTSYSFLNKSLIAKLEGGYSITKYELFNDGQTMDYGISAFEIGDDRVVQNGVFSNNLYFKLGLTYRLYIKEKPTANQEEFLDE